MRFFFVCVERTASFDEKEQIKKSLEFAGTPQQAVAVSWQLVWQY